MSELTINTADIAEAIRKNLDGFTPSLEQTQVGRVLEVGDGIARVSGLPDAAVNELLQFESGTFGLALNLDEESIGAVVLGEVDNIEEGQTVRATGDILSLPVGDGLLGRVVNALGEPIDGKGPLTNTQPRRMEIQAPGIMGRKPVHEPMQTGIKAIDSLIPIGRGQRELIIGDRKTGKTLWLTDPGSSGYATIVPQAKDRHLLFSAKSLMAIDPRDGSKYWDYAWKSSRDVNAADPVSVGDDIVVSSSAGTKRIRPKGNGKVPEDVWHQRDLKWYFNPGVLIDGHLYSLHGTTHRPTELTCTDVETGETIWSEEGFGSGGLMAAGNHVIVFDLGKLTIFQASPKRFTPVLQQEILKGKCWTSPVIANGTIYCRNAVGDIAAVGLQP